MGYPNLLRCMLDQHQAQRFDDGAIARHQDRRLRQLLRHVWAKSRFYRRYYQEHGVDLSGDRADQVKIQDLPPIDKRLVMDNFDDLVCDPALSRDRLEQFIGQPENRGRAYRGRWQVIHTSGSSGTIGIFVYGPNDWDMLRAIIMARVTRTRFRTRRTKLAYIGAVDGNYAGISLVRGAPGLLFQQAHLSVNAPLAAVVDQVNAFQPEILSGYSSGVHLLAVEQIQGRIAIRPRAVFCSADPLTTVFRENIKQAFRVDPVNYYAASESIAMAAQCSVRHGLHLFSDWHCFEVLDRDLRPAGPGQSGALVMTNLYNYTQPLIRYRTHDELVLDPEPCLCGSRYPTIRNIAGREEEFLWFRKPDGALEFIHPIVLIEFYAYGLVKFQFVQPQRNSLLMRAIVRGDRDRALQAIRRRMHAILFEKRLEGVVDFQVQLVDDIGIDPRSEKFKLILSLPRPPEE